MSLDPGVDPPLLDHLSCLQSDAFCHIYVFNGGLALCVQPASPQIASQDHGVLSATSRLPRGVRPPRAQQQPARIGQGQEGARPYRPTRRRTRTRWCTPTRAAAPRAQRRSARPGRATRPAPRVNDRPPAASRQKIGARPQTATNLSGGRRWS